MTAGAEWMERRQVVLAVAALVAGAVIGLLLPGVAPFAEAATTPVLALLLYVTFLGVPVARIGAAFRDGRFLAALLVLNFFVAPAVAFVVSRLVAHDDALLVGVLFVLLTPCVDYVIVFAGLAGGSRDRLVSATPILLLAQMVLLPGYLRLFAGEEVAQAVDLRPFVEAFLILIVLPLAAAALTQLAASRTHWGRRVADGADSSMVPLLMLTLAVVVASQVAGVGERIAHIAPAIPVFIVFAAVMAAAGILVGRMSRLDAPARRALAFSGVTRNSLVVLPLVLALPPAFDVAPLVVVTQTLVELGVMVALVRLVPRLMPERGPE